MTAMGLGPLAAEPAEWMHDAALLAVTHHLQACRNLPAEDLDPRAAWPDRADEWRELVRRAAELPVDTSGWTAAAALAAERFPDAAAAFSILADNPALHLPTPGVFARIAMAGLGLGYDEALAAALLAASAERRRAHAVDAIAGAIGVLGARFRSAEALAADRVHRTRRRVAVAGAGR